MVELLLALFACTADSTDGETERGTDSAADTAARTDTARAVDADGDGSPAGVDCDDADPALFPGAPEVCDRIDNDCDGLVDDDDTVSDGSTWYLDEDEDGYGSDTTRVSCDVPDGHAARGGDCDDTEHARNPEAVEVCGDGIDDNCDDSANSCTLSGEIDLDDHPAGNVILDDGGAAAFALLRGVGDLDGDGAPDILVSSDVRDDVWIFRGAVTGANRPEDAWAHITSGGDVHFARNAHGNFDWDGDGVGDLAISATEGAEDEPGYVRIFTNLSAGDTDGATSAAQLEYANGTYFGIDALVTGDLDGDGDSNDILGRIGNSGTGVAWLAGWRRGSDQLIVDLAVDTTYYFDDGGAALGDADGDGLDDLVFGAPYLETEPGLVDAGTIYVANGPVTEIANLEDTYDVLLTGGRVADYAGNSLDFSGDGDGDGYFDLLVGAPGLSRSPETDVGAYLVRGPLASGSLEDAAASFQVNSGGEECVWVGDVAADGEDRLAITNADRWRVYLYRGSVTGTQEISTAAATFSGTDVRGSNVAAAGDLDLDGHAEILLGGLYQVWDTRTYEAVVVIDGSGI